MSRFCLVPAVYVLLLRDRADGPEVLLQLRGPGTSFMPGHWAAAAAGHVEAGESVFAAAVREAAEELGIQVDPDALEPLSAMHRTLPRVADPVEQRVDFFLTVREWAGEPTIQEPAKCADLGWFGLSRLPDPVVPHERQLLGLLARGRVPAVLTSGF